MRVRCAADDSSIYGTFGDRAFVDNWPRRLGEYDLLYDVTIDGREAADIGRVHPEVLADLRAEWERSAAGLLLYPPEPAPARRRGVSAGEISTRLIARGS